MPRDLSAVSAEFFLKLRGWIELARWESLDLAVVSKQSFGESVRWIFRHSAVVSNRSPGGSEAIEAVI